jgi:hypothetical protein
MNEFRERQEGKSVRWGDIKGKQVGRHSVRVLRCRLVDKESCLYLPMEVTFIGED